MAILTLILGGATKFLDAIPDRLWTILISIVLGFVLGFNACGGCAAKRALRHEQYAAAHPARQGESGEHHRWRLRNLFAQADGTEFCEAEPADAGTPTCESDPPELEDSNMWLDLACVTIAGIIMLGLFGGKIAEWLKAKAAAKQATVQTGTGSGAAIPAATQEAIWLANTCAGILEQGHTVGEEIAKAGLHKAADLLSLADQKVNPPAPPTTPAA